MAELMNVKIDVKNMQLFNKIALLLKTITEDERISCDIRSEYKYKIDEIIEGGCE